MELRLSFIFLQLNIFDLIYISTIIISYNRKS